MGLDNYDIRLYKLIYIHKMGEGLFVFYQKNWETLLERDIHKEYIIYRRFLLCDEEDSVVQKLLGLFKCLLLFQLISSKWGRGGGMHGWQWLC